MTTIIKAMGVNFNNPNLPIVAPMITDGLIAGFRPNNTQRGLIDLSGNGHMLTKKGSPELTAFGIKGNAANGFVSDVPESRSMTIFVTSRIFKSDSGNYHGFALSTYKDTGVTTNRGIGVFYYNDDTKVTTNSNIVAKKLTANEQVNKVAAVRSDLLTVSSPATPFKMIAIVIDADKNHFITYDPASQSAPTADYDSIYDGFILAGRLLSDPLTGKPNMFEIASYTISGEWDSYSEVAEVLFYDKALTQAQIVQQYQYSKDFMSKHRSIAI